MNNPKSAIPMRRGAKTPALPRDTVSLPYDRNSPERISTRRYETVSDFHSPTQSHQYENAERKRQHTAGIVHFPELGPYVTRYRSQRQRKHHDQYCHARHRKVDPLREICLELCSKEYDEKLIYETPPPCRLVDVIRSKAQSTIPGYRPAHSSPFL